MRKILNGIKTMFLKWKEAFFSFCRHPIQYTKDYFKNFKTLSRKEKICKILWAAAFTAASIYVVELVIAIILSFILAGALLSGGGYEYRRVQHAQWMVNEYGGKEADYL